MIFVFDGLMIRLQEDKDKDDMEEGWIKVLDNFVSSLTLKTNKK